MGVTRLFTLLCAASLVYCNTPGTDRPDITMLYKGSQKVCVAGGNTQGYGLAFMPKNIQNYHEYDFNYVDENGNAIDTRNNCDFENREGDTCSRDWLSNDRVNTSSGLNTLPIAPITDERWNNFPVYRTSSIEPNYEHKYDKPYSIMNSFYISFSVRSKNAQILLCSTQNPKSASCYWILTDAFTKNEVTGIRKCARGVPDKWPRNDPDCRMLRDNTTIAGNLLKESKWTHFILSRVNKNRIRLLSWDINTGAQKLLDYTDNSNPLTLSYMYVRSFNATADWKIHSYQYLVTTATGFTNRLIPLGPKLSFASSPICISFYVVLCRKCKMVIRLETEDGIEIAHRSIEGNPNEDFMTWRNIKIQNTDNFSGFNRTFQIYSTISITDPTYLDTFWAIDDFRRCTKNEIIVATSSSKAELLCQSLKYPNWTFHPNKQIDTYEPPICEDGRYIGPYCNISCSVIPNGCADHKICLAIQEGSLQGACTCAAGNRWSNNNCAQACSSGYYGYNCEKKCGQCLNQTCNTATGICEHGCILYELQPPYCQNSYSRLVSPPSVIRELYTSVMVQLNEVKILGSKDIANIRLECKKETGSWHNCSEPILYKNLKNEICISSLEKETLYYIRAVVYSSNGDSYRYNDLPFANATTSCKRNIEVKVTTNARNATIYFQLSEESCCLNNYIVQLNQSNNKYIEQYAKEKMVFKKLQPYTDYKILLSNTKYSDYKETKNFKTEEDAPGEIKTIKYIYSTSTQIFLSVEEPEEKNGIIRYYIVTYELIQRINCSETPSPHKGHFNVRSSNISLITIRDLQPYSNYYITVTAVTILPGKEKGINAKTLMTNDINVEELPKNIFSSSVTSNSVTIRWNAVNCNKHRGPLYFRIVFKCASDDWCNEINDTVLDNINSKDVEATIKLTPFTNYMVELQSKRDPNEELAKFIRSTELFTPAVEPPAVRNFTAYSKNTTSISLRWLEPYPRNGLLENYYIKYCYNPYTYGCKEVQRITATQLSSCDLWNESFKCYVLPNLFTGYDYKIIIKAKNIDTDYGRETNISVRTTDDSKSSAPLNLTHNWENNDITLYWNHPNITNGRIRKFEIFLERNATDLTNQDEIETYSSDYKVDKEMKHYTIKIPKSYRYSSSYVVTVCAVNTVKGENATLIIDTPPETPELDGDVIVDNEKITSTTVTLSIPGVKKNTRSHTSFLYVTVSTSTKSILKREVMKNTVKQEIQKQAGSNNNSWLAIETNLNEKEVIVELGDGQEKFSENLQANIYNKPLEPDSEYIVTVLIINQYREQISSSYYTKNVTTAVYKSSPELYFFLLLLLLPVVGYFTYRYYLKKNLKLEGSTYIESNVPVRHSYLEIIENETALVNNTDKSSSDHEYESVDHLDIAPIDMTDDHVYEIMDNIEKSPTYMNLLKKEQELMYANL